MNQNHITSYNAVAEPPDAIQPMGPGQPIIHDDFWHYHFFEPTWDGRYMRCVVASCGLVKPTCQHKYQSYGEAFHYCQCGDVRRVPGAGIYGKAEAAKPIEGEA